MNAEKNKHPGRIRRGMGMLGRVWIGKRLQRGFSKGSQCPRGLRAVGWGWQDFPRPFPEPNPADF